MDFVGRCELTIMMTTKNFRGASLKDSRSSVAWTLFGALVAGETSQTFHINAATLRIGRCEDMDLCVPSAVVSGRHAQLLRSSGRLYIRDLGSTNGTYVNGHKITHDTELHDKDLIEIGELYFRVRRHDMGLASAPTDPLLSKTCYVDHGHDLAGRRSLTLLLNGGSLLPCFQAIHCLSTGFVRGYEFLARSNYPGIESAGALFEQARKCGREIELSLMCREQALSFSDVLEDHVPVFLNTHPLEPLQTVVVPQLRDLRGRYPHREIVLEIHESAVTEPGLIRQVRKELRECNIRLAFDDFGRGQARIRELICASTDFIKFDAALIHDLQGVSPEQFRFFASIVRGIQKEGAVTVAEGVETEEMAAICRRIGFDLVQGYLFSRPTVLK